MTTAIHEYTLPGPWRRNRAASQWPRMIGPSILLLVLAAPPVAAQTTLRTPAAPAAPAPDNQQCTDPDCDASAQPAENDAANNTTAGNASGEDPGIKGTPQNATKPDALSPENLTDNEAPDNPEKQGHPTDKTRSRGGAWAEKIPEPPPTEFQEFVASSVGRKLPLYGHNLFDHVPSTFAPVDRVPVTGDYVVGPGDQILLRAWGQIDVDAKLLVDRQGNVFLPKVGELFVAGLRYEQLTDYFRGAIGRVFRNFDLTVSLGQLRSIQIFVVGQARRPGTYTVSSLSTLVNALFASGGPSNSGSMRRIELKRNDRVVVEFDLYDLLLHGDKSQDVHLLPGDVIFVPPAGPSIALSGSVNVPGIYELHGETSLEDAVEMAGGLASTADGEKAVVERIDHHDSRSVEEFPLDASGLQRTLKDGDVVRIFPLSPEFRNAVTLRGNVARPGRVEWHAGMRLRDVIPNQETLITPDYWRNANSAATTAKLHDGTTRGLPEINWDYAVIERLDPQDLTTHLIPFNLGKLVLDKDEAENLALQPGDIITVFSQNDLAVPLAKRSKFVRLEGEFLTAGVYRAEPGETIRHLVMRAGGFTPNAYLYGAVFTRESVRKEQQKGLDQLIEQLEEEIPRTALSGGSGSPEDIADQQAKLEAQRQMLAKLRDVKASGRLVLDLNPDSKSSTDLPEIPLEDGDRFVVPYRPATVAVLGAVYNRNSFLYRPVERLDDYLKNAGGPTREADSGRIFVIRADGSILGRQSVKGLWNGGFGSLRLMPGDSIVVPQRLTHPSVLRGLRDWSQVFSQFALGAAAIRVIQ